ncbi:replication endonuclease [Cronobacter turicensis]
MLIGFTAPYWATFQADKLTTRQAECGLLRMMTPAWWYVKIKRVRDVQREHMAIAVGQVPAISPNTFQKILMALPSTVKRTAKPARACAIWLKL